jgi:putative ABC transport system permease protein
MESLWKDITHSARLLWKNRAFTLVAMLTLALGIGANTAIFSMVDWILLRPLPVPQASQITALAFQLKNSRVYDQFSIPDYRDIRKQGGQAFSGVFGYLMGMDGLSVHGKADRIMTNFVTGNYFSSLGLQPAAGRLLLPSEGETPGADPVIVLGYSYWQKRFNGDPSIVGQKVSVNGRPFTIVGVAPKGFYGAYPVLDIQGYMPLGMQIIEGSAPDFMANRGLRNLTVLGRLQPGTSLQQARAALAVIAQRIAQQYPDTDKDLVLRVYPETQSRPQPSAQSVIPLIASLFLGLAAMVLLLACLNVANILLVRATIREKEMAIRAALGAARGRLVRQLLTESVLLALVGAPAGILLGRWGSGALSGLNVHTDLPVKFDFSFDWRVFAYALAAALITGIIVGIVPALRISRGNINSVLHQSGRGVAGSGQGLRSTLVVAQVAGSLMLLIMAGLFMRSLAKAQKADLGFDPAHIVDASMDPSEVGYNEGQGREFYRNLLTRVRQMPGVVSATTSSSIPLGYYNNADALTIDGYQPAPGQPAGASFVTIATDYFETLRIPMVSGRKFTDRDDENAPHVAIVNQAFVNRYWSKQDPLGRHFKLMSDAKHSIEVVGVAKDSRIDGLTGSIKPNIYLPSAQHYACCSLQTLQVRTSGDSASMMPEIERAIHALSPDMPVFDVKPMTQAMETLNGLLMFELGAALAATLGALGLVLSVVGVYGVISYSAAQRTQEIGIRMALGAQPAQIVFMVLRQGVTIIVLGLAVGLVCAFGLARLAAGVLSVSPADPVTYLSVSAVLSAVALAACYIPARRTMRVDPMMALRYE